MSRRARLCVFTDCILGDVPSAQITSGIYPSLGVGEFQLYFIFLRQLTGFGSTGLTGNPKNSCARVLSKQLGFGSMDVRATGT